MFIFMLTVGTSITLSESNDLVTRTLTNSQHVNNPCSNELYSLKTFEYKSVENEKKKMTKDYEFENEMQFKVKVLTVYLMVGASNLLFCSLLATSLNNSFLWDKVGGIFSGFFLILALINLLWWVGYSIRLVI